MLTSQDVAAIERVGYEIDEVRAFLAEVRGTLAAYETRRPLPSPTTASQVTDRSFDLTKFRDGFDQVEVDRYRKQLVETLREYESAP